MFKRILKILLVILNTAIFLAGAAIVVIGILVVNNKNYFFETLNKIKGLPTQLSYFTNAGYLLLAVGAVITIIGFLGCCGAFWENQCMLMIFFIIILLAFVAEVTAVVLILFQKPKAEELLTKIRDKVAKNIQETYGKNDITTNMWNETMTLLKCCGYNNYTDFTDSPYVNKTSHYPKFCCSSGSSQCDLEKAESENVNGCFTAVVKWLKKNSAFLQGIAICVAAIEVGVMIVTLILIKT